MSRTLSFSIDEIIDRRKIIITCGTGGVGKTTLSAAIALRAGMRGKKTAVITTDPAKRLATALGFKELGDTPLDLSQSFKARTGQDLAAPVHALVPDTRRTFEQFVRRLAPFPGIAEKIIQHSIFKVFAKEFSGTNEYMALERLYSLHQLNAYDCIILDTPPSRQTVQFLKAPTLLAELFEEGVLKWLALPGNKLFSMAVNKALGVLERLTGGPFMRQLTEFASVLFDIRSHFVQNYLKINQLLESPQTGFLMVAAPNPEILPDATHFVDELNSKMLHFEGIALNRSLAHLDTSHKGSSPQHQIDYVMAQLSREKATLNALKKSNIQIVSRLPELSRDIHTLEDLHALACYFDKPLATAT